jgi:hypothetical protein
MKIRLGKQVYEVRFYIPSYKELARVCFFNLMFVIVIMLAFSFFISMCLLIVWAKANTPEIVNMACFPDCVGFVFRLPTTLIALFGLWVGSVFFRDAEKEIEERKKRKC